MTVTSLGNGDFQLDWSQRRGLYYKVRRTPDLENFTDETVFSRAFDDRASAVVSPTMPAIPVEFFDVMQSDAK